MIVAGTPVARDEGLGMTVYRVDGPIKVRAELVGLYPGPLVRGDGAATPSTAVPAGR